MHFKPLRDDSEPRMTEAPIYLIRKRSQDHAVNAKAYECNGVTLLGRPGIGRIDFPSSPTWRACDQGIVTQLEWPGALKVIFKSRVLKHSFQI